MMVPGDAESQTTITVNGRTYHSVEEMPPAVREEYERAMGELMADRDANGVPDVMEGQPPPPGTNVITQFTRSERYVVNGQEYSRLEDVPPPFREALSRALSPTGDPFSNSVSSGGVTFHITWPRVATILVAVAIIVATVAWILWD